MKKLLSILLVAVLALPLWAAVTPDDTPNGFVGPKTKYYVRYNAIDIDSIAGNDATEFGKPCAMNLFGFGQPFPDAIALNVEVRAGGTITLTVTDTVMVRLWVSNATDSTNLAAAAMSWRPLHLNADEDTIALGPTDDDLATTTYDAHGIYAFSAAQLVTASAANYLMIELDFSTGGASANDTCGVGVDVVQRYTGWITQ
jgi:hypothetical protein